MGPSPAASNDISMREEMAPAPFLHMLVARVNTMAGCLPAHLRFNLSDLFCLTAFLPTYNLSAAAHAAEENS